MELAELLKKLHKLEPDADYARKSRRIIISREKNVWPGFSLSRFAVSIFQSGSAIAMTAALLLLALGSFSLWKIFSPANPLTAELTGLQAEAKAIDIQIQLTDVAYREPAFENKTSTAPFAHPAASAKNSSGTLDPQAEQEAKNLGLTPAGSSTGVLIDEALDKLAE